MPTDNPQPPRGVGPHLPGSADLKSVLEHARTQFQYHAGQRLNTIRYYFIAYAIFVAAYVSAQSKADTVPHYLQFAMSLSAFLITIGFWILDFRNAQLVEVDEGSLIELEDLVAKEFKLTRFEITKEAEKKGQIRRYKVVVNALYLFLSGLTGVALVHDFLNTFCIGSS